MWRTKDCCMFMINFVLSNTPLRCPESVLIFIGDSIFTQQMVKEFGFLNAHYLRDWFHLFDIRLVDIFGEKDNTSLRSYLIHMIKADPEGHFQKALSNTRLILRQEQSRYADLEATLEQVACENAEYSKFQIDKMSGSRGLHGSSVSKQNHSSTLCHLTDGKSKDNQYGKEPVTYVKDLFRRQQKLNMKMNELLFDAKLQLSIEREHVMHESESYRKV